MGNAKATVGQTCYWLIRSSKEPCQVGWEQRGSLP